MHVEICEYAHDVKRKVEDAGGRFKVSDDGLYCDDDAPVKGDLERLERRFREENEQNRATLRWILGE